MHYMRVRKHGDPLAFHPNARRRCSVDGCSEPHSSKGFCANHYARFVRHGDPTKIVRETRSGDGVRFIEWAVQQETDDCILWPYAKLKSGHPRLDIGGRAALATREVLFRVQGPPPTKRHQAAHAPVICHTPSCINPKHLRWATARENSADRRADGTHHCGERIARAKLTADQVLAIRADPRPHKEIAVEYEVDVSHISGIKTRRTWRHLP